MWTRMKTLAMSVVTIAIALAPGVVFCQVTVVPPVKGNSPSTGAVDESALRYYAAKKDAARVELETRRLKRLNPRWQPPVDLGSAEIGGGDEDDLWDLFAADRLDELQATIAARVAAQPSWKPSRDLIEKIKQKRLRDEILKGSKAGNWYEVSSLSGRLNVRASAQDTELMWTVAEGFARIGQFDQAGVLLASALEGATDGPVRTAVVLRAFALLPFADAEKLLSQAHRGPNGESEFDAIADDISRARISAILRDEGGVSLTPEQHARLGVLGRESKEPTYSELLGWYALKTDMTDEAFDWFKLSISRGGEAMVAHGLAQSLLRRGQLVEAEDVAHAWRNPIANNSIFFTDILETKLTLEIPPEIPGERLTRYAKETVETQSGEGAQGLAWYSYNSCQYDKALEWFERAVAWHPKETTVYGYALALRRLKRAREFIEVVNRYDGVFPMVVGLVMEEQQTKPGPCDAAQSQQPIRATAKNANQREVRAPEPTRSIPRPEFGNAVSASGNPFVRAGFPASVNPANPLRFSSRGAGVGAGSVAGAGWRAERPNVKWPLVARRVRGAIAMPYERFGYSLLPGIDGVDQPETRTVAEIPAALGTLWSRNSKINAANVTTNTPANSANLTSPRLMRSYNTPAR